MAKKEELDLVSGNLFDKRSDPTVRHIKGPPGFNKQAGRRAMFRAIMAAHPFSAIVETGTSYGNTTRFMARRVDIPIHTIEIDQSRTETAGEYLSEYPNVRQYRGDSRNVLADLLDNGTLPARDVFAYLDAHWLDHLPLIDELTALLDKTSDFVAIVDDFRVPDDPEYGYDRYGDNGTLEADLLAPLASRFAGAFYPAMPARHETGARRGCIVLTDSETLAAKLGSLAELRPAAL